MRQGVLLAVVVGLAAGCGSSRVPVYPVSGRLTVNGKLPDKGWIAALHLEPAPDPSAPYPHPLPRAQVGADGHFQFRTYEAGDGAPAGTFKISFIWMGDREDEMWKEDTEDQSVKKGKKPPGNKPGQVYWPQPLEIRSEANELPPFHIPW